MKVSPLIRGECPVCKKRIMNDQKTAYINGGREFWVEFSDNSKAVFAICDNCYDMLTQEQLDEIMRAQIVNWGIDISRQLEWYYKKAVHLKIIKYAKDKNGLQNSV